jgi:multiple sugar transport system substrate-binding protein
MTMPVETLRVALIAGPMYDRLNRSIPRFERETGVRVCVAFRAPHPELNAHYDTLPAAPYDLISSHTKYAPAQFRLLAPLDAYAHALDLAGFAKPLLELARVDGRLYGLPRTVDFKLLHYRTDLMDAPPETWDDLCRTARRISTGGKFGFVFCGRDSGLLGIFYELAEMAGAKIFTAGQAPDVIQAGASWALETLRDLYRHASPQELTGWHYAEVHRFFLEGSAAMVCDWPAYYSSYRKGRDSKVKKRFALARMPAGPVGRRAYSGCHTFALTPMGIRKPAAVELLRFLTAPEQQLLEAGQGAIPARTAARRKAASADPAESGRWKLIGEVLKSDLLVPPAIPYYPAVEEVLWRGVQAAITGEMTIREALALMQRRLSELHRAYRHLPAAAPRPVKEGLCD